MQIPDIKKQLPIMSVLAHYGIKPDKNDHIKCPFHKDDKPSCKIYTETNTYNCFGCGKTGDVIQFIQDKENCSKHEALKKAAELAGEQTNNTDVMGIASKRAAEAENFAELFNRQKEGLPRSPKAQEYLRNRCLEQLQEVGYNSGVNWKKLKQCITFPLKDKNGNIVSLYGRRIAESNGHNVEFGKHYYTENRKGLYPGYPDTNTETLIITEAIIDAASLLQCTDTLQSVSVLAAYGTNGLTAEHKAAIAEWSSSGVEKQEIIFFFDGDNAGREGVIKNTENVQELLSGVEVTSVPTPDGEDINSLFVNYGKEAILQLIEERQPVVQTQSVGSRTQCHASPKKAATTNVQTHCHASPKEATTEVKTHCSASQQLNLSPLDTNQPNKIIHETPTARYIIKGSLPKTFDRMLVSLDVQHLETAIKYRCRLNLYEEKQTRKEAREASEKLELRSDLVENDLSQLTDLLEEYREKHLLRQGYEDQSNNDKPLTLAEQAQTKAFLQKENLIQELNDLIGKSGIVGEENNRIFLFVIASSHKMKDTLHALIQGSSGSGKTHLLSKIAALMPSERVVKFTRVTENSFYNYDEFFFKNKLICLEDIDGLKEEALFAWRELISNNQLSSSTSQKDENGNIRSAQRIVRGPMASICATTHGAIYEDNMSRLFIIAVDESGEQTKRIMDYQKQKAAGLIDAEKEKEATELLQNIVRMLKPCKVVNPFAYQIHLPEKAHKIRRLNELYLAFVKQVTIINQYQRKRDAQGRIITETEDLLTANEIMFDSIFLKVDELDGSLRQFYEELKNHIKTKSNPEQYEFMQREIRHALNISKSQLQRYINDLVELEYLQQMGGYQNRGYKYKILWWDDIAKLREDVKQYLKNQIDRLENNNQ
ncbi:DNA primase [Salinivirga cyanobacteriivorans]|uniref:DNA primase n=1 Tax=Salinivirga cyanobacteriivorans TaxID=1307839 RepID=A0A0S2HV82_9BACT|nr:CHC2 zinc finger domain-containing protein [Salinivirga cyanobacteriivorans]ALO13927.1 DNA primase [Salinivirga cyanobacteriivorans]